MRLHVEPVHWLYYGIVPSCGKPTGNSADVTYGILQNIFQYSRIPAPPTKIHEHSGGAGMREIRLCCDLPVAENSTRKSKLKEQE